MDKEHGQSGAIQEAEAASSGAKFSSLALANATVVGLLYWNQTILREVAQSFPHSDLAALIPSVTLAGYAVGVACVAWSPVSRARFPVEHHLGCLTAALLAAGLSANVPSLAAANFFVGCGAAVAPRLLANAARLVQPAKAGAAIGRVICGGLVMILCVRLFGGSLAAIAGWRMAFAAAAALVAGLALLIRRTGKTCTAQPTGGTPPSILARLWRAYPPLRQAALQQGCLFAAYSASWMAVLVELPANQRPLVILGGSCAGILAAMLAGGLADKTRQGRIAGIGAAAVFTAGSVILPAAYGSGAGPRQVALLLVGIGLVDAGLQLALVANQRRIQALEPSSRTRLAATLTVCGFAGGAVGAGAGHMIWQAFGWQAAIGFVALTGAVALACSLLPLRRQVHREDATFPSRFAGHPVREGIRRRDLRLRSARQPSSPHARDSFGARHTAESSATLQKGNQS